MIKGDYTIKIVVTKTNDDEMICGGHSLSFESAFSELGKLERYIEKVERDEFMKSDDKEYD